MNIFGQITKPSAVPSKVPAGMDAAAKVLKMTPAEYQKQMESYLKMYKMEGQQGITQLLALQKTDPSNSMLYQQMISLLRSKINKVSPTVTKTVSEKEVICIFFPSKNAASKPKNNAGVANSSNSTPKATQPSSTKLPGGASLESVAEATAPTTAKGGQRNSSNSSKESLLMTKSSSSISPATTTKVVNTTIISPSLSSSTSNKV